MTHGFRTFSFGAQGKFARIEGDFARTPTPNGYMEDPDILNLANAWDTTAWKGNACVQLARTFFDRLRVTVGGRLDYFNLIDEPSAVGPRASLRYGLSGLTALTLGGGRYYQSPSYIWLLSNAANTRLRHVRVDQSVLGVEHLRDTDLRVQKRLSDIPFYGIFSLSYNSTEYVAIDGVTRPGAYDSRFILNLSGGGKIDEHWEVGAKFRYGSGTPTTPFLPTGLRDYAAYNGDRLPAFHSLDLRIDRRWLFSDWNLVIYIDVQNVYNHKNAQAYRWAPRNRRPETVGGGIGILPAIGASARNFGRTDPVWHAK